MIVSDGEWSASSHIEKIVPSSTEKGGARFHEIQVGGYGHGLKQLYDNVHHFKSWNMI